MVILNSDVIPLRGWLAALQYAAEQDPRRGIIAAKLLYPNQRIQYAGTVRNATEPDWYDHRHRGRPAAWGPANVAGPTLAATAAAMYVRRAVLDAIGPFDEAYPMGFEDVDYSLRAWQAGFEVHYAPSAQLHHLESATRGLAQGERELTSQRVFWERWRSFIDERAVLTDDGRLRVRYVTEGTIVGGGHRLDLRAAQRPGRPGPRRRAVDAGACTDMVRAALPGADLRRLSRAGGCAGRGGGDQGRDLVADRAAGLARIGRAAASRSTSCRTSRPATTPTPPSAGTRCWTPTGPSSATSPPRAGIATGWPSSVCEAELIAPGIDLDTFRPLPGVGAAS